MTTATSCEACEDFDTCPLGDECPLAPMEKWVEKIKVMAEERYENGGWDVIVECYTDSELLALISHCSTWEEALAFIRHCVSVWAEKQADARNSAF